ncbi:MAG: histidine kinase [Arenimonas sp.]
MNDSLQLNQALPDDVVAGGSFSFFSYRNFPVFSLPWLKKRSVLMGVFIALFSLPVGIGLGMLSQDASFGTLAALHFFVGFLIISTAGPMLATWVRHQQFSLTKERRGVVLAILAGIVISYFADQWTSNYLKKLPVQNLQSQTVTMAPGNASKAAEPANEKATINQEILSNARPNWVIAVNLVFLALIYGSLGGGLGLRSYFSEQRRLAESRHKNELNAIRLQKDESDLRLGVLQAQIEPHFLFNTLASLRSLIKQDPDRAETTLDALVDHLRATIPKLREQQGGLVSTLGQQIDICTSYLKLMQVRMGSRLSYEVQMLAEYRELNFPPLMLISLVENAIKHGLETKSGAGKIIINVTKVDAKHLRVSVSDDGIGLKAGLGGGLGLANIREQLSNRFGNSASLSIAAQPEAGTIVTIELPLSEANA